MSGKEPQVNVRPVTRFIFNYRFKENNLCDKYEKDSIPWKGSNQAKEISFVCSDLLRSEPRFKKPPFSENSWTHMLPHFIKVVPLAPRQPRVIKSYKKFAADAAIRQGSKFSANSES